MARDPEPDDGIYRFSATKINTVLECERKFGFQYIAKIPRVEHGSAALGSACHKQLEDYLEHGKPLDYSQIVAGRYPAKVIAPSLKFLPAPKTPGMQIEQHFKWVTPKGHLFIGYKDVRLVGGDVPLVIDHKTSSNIAEWGKKASDLPTDPQAVIYAADELARDPTAPAVDLMWVYSQTKGREHSEPVRLRVLRNDPTFLRAVDAIDLLADGIAQHVSSKTAPNDMTPNTRACGAFGGCPYKVHCTLSSKERFRSMANANGKADGDLLSVLEARSKADGGGAPPAPPTATAAAVAPPSLAWLFAPKDPGPGTNLPEGYKPPPAAPSPGVVTAMAGGATERGIPADMTPKSVPVSPPDPDFVKKAVDAVIERAEATGVLSPFPPTDMPINPPEFQRAPTPEEMAAKDAAADAEKSAGRAPKGDGGRFRRTAAEIAAGLTVEQAKAARGVQVVIGVPANVPTLDATDLVQLEAAGAISVDMRDAALALLESPGEMPTFLSVDASGVRSQRVERIEAPATMTVPFNVNVDEAALDAFAKKHGLEPRGFTLYVDCLPLGGAVEQASKVIAEVHAEIRVDLNVVDYRVGAPVEYGKGAGMLSLGVAEVAKLRNVDLYLDTRTPEGAVVKDALVAAAGAVVMGVR